MIREEIFKLAKSLGIKKCGFSKNSFVALFPYYKENEKGNISIYARGLDYHNVIKKYLEPLADRFIELGGTGEIHVDKGVLNDREAAYQAGLGFYGMNGMLICEEYGSYFFIGQVIHGLEIESDFPMEKECLKCGECIRRCPGEALGIDGFKIEKCLSHITQKKGELNQEEKALIVQNKMCWGCDVCQQVCPHNKKIGDTAIKEFLENRIKSLELNEFEKLSNREFKEKYGEYSFSWRGKNVLLRNLELISNEEKLDGEK